MAGRTPYQVVRDFRQAIGRVLACVTPAVVTLSERANEPSRPGEPPRALLLAAGNPVALEHEREELALRVRLHYRITGIEQRPGFWKIDTAAYWYAIEDRSEREILAFHWHPEGRSAVTYPHLHIGGVAGLPPDGVLTRRTHVPTGQIGIEDVVRMLIMELGVQPRRGVNWKKRLDDGSG